MSTPVSLERNTGLISMGTHTFKIIKFSEEQGTNGPYWRYTVACADAQGDDRGKEALMMLSLSPAARFRFDEFFDAMNSPKKGTATGEQFVGRSFKATVSHEDYEGRTQVRFKGILPAGDAQLPLSTAPAASRPAPARGGGIPADATEDEDEVPF